jgi:hypothetical protein
MTKNQAQRLVLQFIHDSLDRGNHFDFILEKQWTIKIDEGWVFFYNPEKYIKTRDVKYLVPGHAPLIVNKFNRSIFSTGVTQTLQYYIDAYHHFAQAGRIK